MIVTRLPGKFSSVDGIFNSTVAIAYDGSAGTWKPGSDGDRDLRERRTLKRTAGADMSTETLLSDFNEFVAESRRELATCQAARPVEGFRQFLAASRPLIVEPVRNRVEYLQRRLKPLRRWMSAPYSG